MSYILQNDLTDNLKYKITDIDNQYSTSTIELSGSNIFYTPDSDANYVAYNLEFQIGCRDYNSRTTDMKTWLEIDDGQGTFSTVNNTTSYYYIYNGWGADRVCLNFVINAWEGQRNLKVMSKIHNASSVGRYRLHRPNLWESSDSNNTEIYSFPVVDIYSIF